MKRTVVVLLHSGYWLIYLLLLSVIFAIAEMQVRRTPPNLWSYFPLIILCVVPNLVSFYSFYFLLFSKFLSHKKILLLIIFGALVCLISAFSGAFISLIFFGFEQAIFSDAHEFFSLTASLFVIAAIHGGIALVIRGFIIWYTELKLKEELAQRNFEMELALIKSQINPHFLFNTINNIDFLITKNADLASEYLNKLSDILRYMVYETKYEKIPLAKELDYIEKYLALQKIRTTNPNYINFEVAGKTNNLTIAPMILFPFIENAFKHTENQKSQNSISVKVSIENHRIIFDCENSYQTNRDKKQDFGGLGNELIKKRLMLTYPEKHLLKIEDADGVYKVKLTLNEN
jgi:sensor histidine kinase YesM